jgi:hypothetical protein
MEVAVQYLIGWEVDVGFGARNEATSKEFGVRQLIVCREGKWCQRTA